MIRSITLLLLLSFSATAQVVPVGDDFYLKIEKSDDTGNYLNIAVCSGHDSSLVLRKEAIPKPLDVQKLFICRDYNFDGHPDLAICNGDSFCNEGRGYDIHLWDTNTFEYNEELSDLINTSCELIEFDDQHRRINTQWKGNSVCCYVRDQYAVINNKPVLLESVMHNYNSSDRPYIYEVTTTKYNKRDTTTIVKEYPQGETQYSFSVTNHKKVVFFEYDHILRYAFLAGDGSIEMYYPHNTGEFTVKGQVVSFKNEGIIYEISPLGVKVKIKERVYDIPADERSIQGSWDDLRHFDNIRVLQ